MQADVRQGPAAPALKSLQTKVAAADPNVATCHRGDGRRRPDAGHPGDVRGLGAAGQGVLAIIGGADPVATMTAAGKTINAAIAKG